MISREQARAIAEAAASARGVGKTIKGVHLLEIWVIRRDGSGLRRLTTNTYFDEHPSW